MLLASALAPPGACAQSAVARASREIRSWERLAAAAAGSQLRPRLARLIASVEPDGEDARAARDALVRDACAHEGRGRLMAAELIRVHSALTRAGIEAAPFKGPSLAQFVGDGTGTREMNDLDLIIDASSLARAADALSNLGYAPALPRRALECPWLARVSNEAAFLGPGAMLLELHWSLAQPWCPAPIRARDVLSRLGVRDFHGASLPWPQPEELLLILVADGVKPGGGGLRWVGDLADLLRKRAALDWDRVAGTARENGGLNSVRIALALVEDLSRDVARALELPKVVVELPPPAMELAREARRSKRLAAAIEAMRARLAADGGFENPAESFRWAVQVSDRPAHALARILAYLTGPSVADLAAMPREGLGDARLRARALRRRLGLRAR